MPKKQAKPVSGHRRDPGIVDGVRPPERMWSFFLDSGAHALFNQKIMATREITSPNGTMTDRQRENISKLSNGAMSSMRRATPSLFRGVDFYKFYKTPEFWAYVDSYAAFVKENLHAIDYYVNVDAIYEPAISWKVLKYLEHEHGLSPVPVIHADTHLKWVDKHLEEGYTFIGLGGLGQNGTAESYKRWADLVYRRLCPASNGYLPLVRTHGFAMTAHELMIRYPWWSVDSASWTKAGAFGSVYVPQMRNKKWRFDMPPLVFHASIDSPSRKKRGGSVRHWLVLTEPERKVIRQWLDEIGVPVGEATEEGVEIEFGIVTHHSARKIANLRYFQALSDWIPQWPWPFKQEALGTLGLDV